MIMKEWGGNAHGDQGVRLLWEKRVGPSTFAAALPTEIVEYNNI